MLTQAPVNPSNMIHKPVIYNRIAINSLKPGLHWIYGMTTESVYDADLTHRTVEVLRSPTHKAVESNNDKFDDYLVEVKVPNASQANQPIVGVDSEIGHLELSEVPPPIRPKNDLGNGWYYPKTNKPMSDDLFNWVTGGFSEEGNLNVFDEDILMGYEQDEGFIDGTKAFPDNFSEVARMLEAEISGLYDAERKGHRDQIWYREMCELILEEVRDNYL